MAMIAVIMKGLNLGLLFFYSSTETTPDTHSKHQYFCADCMESLSSC
jgi:hypothetical protein